MAHMIYIYTCLMFDSCILIDGPTVAQNPEIWVFPNIVVPKNGWFIMENPIKIDDLGVPLFLETPIWHETVKSSPVLKHWQPVKLRLWKVSQPPEKIMFQNWCITLPKLTVRP